MQVLNSVRVILLVNMLLYRLTKCYSGRTKQASSQHMANSQTSMDSKTRYTSCPLSLVLPPNDLKFSSWTWSQNQSKLSYCCFLLVDSWRRQGSRRTRRSGRKGRWRLILRCCGSSRRYVVLRNTVYAETNRLDLYVV